MNKNLWLVPHGTITLWRELLDHVRVQYPDAFIAGGAVRDAIYRRVPNDIDIFTWLPMSEEHRHIHNPLATGDQNIDIALEDGTRTSGRLAEVSRYMNFKHSIYQIVQVNPQCYEPGNCEAVVKQFGLGVQQAWYDGNDVHATPAFEMNHRMKCVTVEYCESEQELGRLMRKVGRMVAAYGISCGQLIIRPTHLHYLTGITSEQEVSSRQQPA